MWKPPAEVDLAEETGKALEKPKVWKAPVFQLPESEEKVVVPMMRRTSEDYANQLRKVTRLKAIRAIWEKPKGSFVPLFANLHHDVFYFPEDCVMINKELSLIHI